MYDYTNDLILRLESANNGTAVYHLIDFGVRPEKLLLKDRYLENYMRFDNEAENFQRIYRRILEDHDTSKGTVFLSKEGSRRQIENLSIPDKEFTLSEIYDHAWRVRPKDWKLDDGRTFWKWRQDQPNKEQIEEQIRELLSNS